MGPISHPDDPEDEREPAEHRRDEKINDAKSAILRFLLANKDRVFYERQLAVIFERPFFHWISVKALSELVTEGSICSHLLELAPGVPIRFFRTIRNRYWKRQAREIIKLVSRFSQSDFTHAIGSHGELLIDAALPAAGFSPVDRNVRSFNGRNWTTTGHDLDRVVQRDGIYYGVEIKNTLPYIPRDEFKIKLAMCEYLGLIPLFVSRMAPKTYTYEIIKKGGVSWILGTQFYPFGHQDLADAVRHRLTLPVACPARIEDGAITRLLKALHRQT